MQGFGPTEFLVLVTTVLLNAAFVVILIGVAYFIYGLVSGDRDRWRVVTRPRRRDAVLTSLAEES